MQHGIPTVGDTITVVRWIAAPAGAVVEARAPTDSTVATLTAPPALTREGDSVRIAYPLAVWAAGRNDLVIPGAIVVAANGRVDTLPDSRVTLIVASVLPQAKSTAAIAPRTARPWLPRAFRSELPFAVLLPAALIIVMLLQWWWRHRGPTLPVATAEAPPPGLTAARVEAWLAAGESHLVLEHLESLVRDRAEFADWRARAAGIRFAPGNESDAAELARDGWARLVTTHSVKPDGAERDGPRRPSTLGSSSPR